MVARFFIPFFVMLGVMVMPGFAAAQGFVPQCASVPIPRGGGATYNACNFCHVMQLINNVIEFVIQISFVLFVFVLLYAGFQLVVSQGNPTAKNEAKEKFVNLIVGFLIVLSAWLIVDTIMKVLVNPAEVGPWNEIECGEVRPPNQPGGYAVEFDADHEATNPADGSAGGTVNPDGTSIAATTEGLESLRDKGVQVADWNGTNGPGRTDQVAPEVADAVLRMQQTAEERFGKRVFQVTAATTDGVGHSANSKHYDGIAVDLDPINDATTEQVKQLADEVGCTFILDHGSHVHCDFR